MDERLQKACAGKSASQGGLNVGDLASLAKAQGYSGPSKRADLIAFLCHDVGPRPAPAGKKPASNKKPAAGKKPAPMVKVTKTQAHGKSGRLSARAYYNMYGDQALGDVCDIRGDGSELKCLLLRANGSPYWAKPSKSGEGQEACGNWSDNCREHL